MDIFVYYLGSTHLQKNQPKQGKNEKVAAKNA